MINLSRKSLLALEAVLDVAIHARPDPVQAREITKRQGVPQRYLEQVMQALVRANILRGVRGPRGGYRLARERRRISVLDIVSVIAALDENETDPISHSQIGQKVIEPLCEQLQKSIEREISGLTIADLCNTAEENGQDIVPISNSDFTI
ncbi:Rrf2 family transcriptional regulator [Alphaproteobacteria bacterium]|nr:Rrf2 family transcriptional regulator [Alphaproteobacteria bacterium]MDC0148319.1 Rrf2 family transcriptional regulator [Alphaproteobacteria bacterium]